MIRGSKVQLKAIEPEDVSKHHAWINDEESNNWRGLYHPTSKEEAQKWIEEHRTSASEKLNLSIWSNEGQHIGFIGLQNICSRSRRAELWIYIGDKNYWGQGIGEDCIRAICKYAFEQMNLHRLWLECNPEFSQVVKCYEKVGFKREGTLRDAYYRNGEFRDTCIMALLRAELIEREDS